MAITKRAVKGSALTHEELDANFNFAIDTPVALTATTVLSEAAHADREIFTTSASPVNHTLPATATTGKRFFGVNLGAGAITLLLNGGGAVPGNALLPATVDQFSAWEVRRHATGFVRVA